MEEGSLDPAIKFKKGITFPEGFENKPKEEQQRFIAEQLENPVLPDQIPEPENAQEGAPLEYPKSTSKIEGDNDFGISPELFSQLEDRGIGVKIDQHLISDTGIMYDKEAEILSIRPGKNPEAINNYIREVVLVTPDPDQVEQSAESVSGWQDSQEFKDLKEARAKYALAKNNAKNDEEIVSISLNSSSNQEEIARLEYEEKRKTLAEKIKESFRSEMGIGPLTSEQDATLNSKTNDAIFEELVQKEHDEYIKALRADRGETIGGKVWEGAKNLLGTKAVKWYLGLSRKQRMFCSFGVGSVVGLAYGAAIAPGMVGLGSYIAWRAARVGLSGTASMKAGEWANKIWSPEKLKQEEDEEVEALKNSGLSLEEQSKGLEDIRKRYKKERVISALAKGTFTVAAGMGTGILTGLAEHAVMGVGGATRTALESKGGKASNIQDHRLSRKGFEPNIKSQEVAPAEQVAAQPEEAQVAQNIPEEVQEVFNPTAPPSAEKIFSDPSTLKHFNESGDSNWGILEKTMEHDERFKKLTEAQKTYMTSTYLNKGLRNPEINGWDKDGGLTIGKETDLTELFKDREEYESILTKAQGIEEGSPRETSILENNVKIANWVKENPGKPVTSETLPEILKPKLKVEITEGQAFEPTPTPEAEVVPIEQPKLAPNSEELNRQLAATESRIKEIEKALEQNSIGEKFKTQVDQIRTKILRIQNEPDSPLLKQEIEDVQDDLDRIIHDVENLSDEIKKPIAAHTNNLPNTPLQREVQNDIAGADMADPKSKFGVIEGGKHQSSLRTLKGDEAGLMKGIQTDAAVERAFRGGVDSVYGKSGFLGLSKTVGIDTKEWAFMSRQPALRVIKYYTEDSTKSGLAPEIANELAKSKNHNLLVKEITNLMGEVEDVKPYENENIGDFLKRLSGKVLQKHNFTTLNKAA